MTADELDLVETKDLIAALKRRSPAGIVGLADGKPNAYRLQWWGPSPLVLWMATVSQQNVTAGVATRISDNDGG